MTANRSRAMMVAALVITVCVCVVGMKMAQDETARTICVCVGLLALLWLGGYAVWNARASRGAPDSTSADENGRE
jgi:hypothetical protein